MIRPWVTPTEVKAYSDFEDVQARSDAKLAVDIARAEQYVIAKTNNRFDDAETYAALPEPVRTAVILLAERYGHAAYQATRMKSESFDDYTYTAETSAADIAELDIDALIEGYKIAAPKGNVTARLRKL